MVFSWWGSGLEIRAVWGWGVILRMGQLGVCVVVGGGDV